MANLYKKTDFGYILGMEKADTAAVFKDRAILVVEDDDVINNVMQKVLTKMGFASVETTSDGSSALKILEKKHVDVILCDVNMSPMCGLEFIRTLRSGGYRFDTARARTPVIFMTGSQEIGPLKEAKKLGAHGYLLKPFSQEEMRDRLVSVLRKKKRE